MTLESGYVESLAPAPTTALHADHSHVPPRVLFESAGDRGRGLMGHPAVPLLGAVWQLPHHIPFTQPGSVLEGVQTSPRVLVCLSCSLGLDLLGYFTWFWSGVGWGLGFQFFSYPLENFRWKRP